MMENDGNMIIPILGYIITVLSPPIGLIYGAALVFLKKDVALYQKHGRFIIYLAIAVFIILFIINYAILVK